jgi:hypothetical protein
MSKCEQSKAVPRRKRAEAIASENDWWVCAVIFTIAALTALFVATLFCVAIG